MENELSNTRITGKYIPTSTSEKNEISSNKLMITTNPKKTNDTLKVHNRNLFII
jgi:hypothetical protein